MADRKWSPHGHRGVFPHRIRTPMSMTICLQPAFAGRVAANDPLEAELLALQKGLQVCQGLKMSFCKQKVIAWFRWPPSNRQQPWRGTLYMATWLKTMELLTGVHVRLEHAPLSKICKCYCRFSCKINLTFQWLRLQGRALLPPPKSLS